MKVFYVKKNYVIKVQSVAIFAIMHPKVMYARVHHICT